MEVPGDDDGDDDDDGDAVKEHPAELPKCGGPGNPNPPGPNPPPCDASDQSCNQPPPCDASDQSCNTPPCIPLSNCFPPPCDPSDSSCDNNNNNNNDNNDNNNKQNCAPGTPACFNVPQQPPPPPDPIQQYDQCSTQVQNQAGQNSTTVTVLQQVSFGNAIAGCGLTGPDVAFCVGAVSGVNSLVSVVNWVGYHVAVYNGQTQCMQGQ